MACGVPVVATAVGGQIDSVVDGMTGVHVPPRDPRRSPPRSARCSTDPSAAAVLGAAARDARAPPLRPRPRRRRDARRLRRRASHRAQAGRADGAHARGPGVTSAAHLAALDRAARRRCARRPPRIDRWGAHLAGVLSGGGRLLAAGNGGSAAQAQHLTAELVGRYRDDRPPLSAIALCTRAVGAHGDRATTTASRRSSPGRCARTAGPATSCSRCPPRAARPNVLAAATRPAALGLTTWALTGPAGNPLAARADGVRRRRRPTHRDGPGGPPGRRPPALRRGRRGARRPHHGASAGRWRRERLVVVGDALLDRDLDGRAERLAPDAPVPVVDGVEAHDRARRRRARRGARRARRPRR